MSENHKNCVTCNKPYIAKRSDGMYCSGSCKQKAFLKSRGRVKLNANVLLRNNNNLKRLIKLHIEAEDLLLNYLPEQLKVLLKELNDNCRLVIKENNTYLESGVAL